MSFADTMTSALSPSVRELLASVEVDPGGRAARVLDRELTAQTPRDLQHKLSAAFYDAFHAGREPMSGGQQRTLRDPRLEARFAAAMPHTSSLTRVRPVGDGPNGTRIVEYHGVRVLLPAGEPEPATGAASAGTASAGAVTVRLPAARPAISPGYFMADGSRGTVAGRRLLRVYVHLTTVEAAVEAWRRVLGALEEAGVPYRAKVASSERLLPRRDALVVYLGTGAWQAARTVAGAVRGLAGVGDEVSLLAEELAPGVAVAWEPDDLRPGMRRLSFGEHRASALAEALVHHSRSANAAGPEATVLETFTAAGIDPACPARNLDSPVLGLSAAV
ncbi:T3SS effector HopA1 family protein [Kitasatospora sp. NPDC086791]|uniref:T3SS effector HopA1 family protein n=1 Tax=Kitasatospora sp. NPDC086791 TaxID=3155178 RepID=UPI003430DAA0